MEKARENAGADALVRRAGGGRRGIAPCGDREERGGARLVRTMQVTLQRGVPGVVLAVMMRRDGAGQQWMLGMLLQRSGGAGVQERTFPNRITQTTSVRHFIRIEEAAANRRIQRSSKQQRRQQAAAAAASSSNNS